MKKKLCFIGRGLLLALPVYLFLIQCAYSQNVRITVSGKISDESNNPLSGVTVQVKGKPQMAATTDDKGDFSISVEKGTETLVFSMVGYALQEIALNGKTQLTVILKPSSKSLEDVVVIGYGTRRRGDVTGAVASVSPAQIREVPVTNISQALQGRVPGLVATTNNFRPGAGATIRIRGNRSLTANNEPLYVVDGIPIENGIDELNPLDIESIDVLKDASATAIYGSRGANGVIQITTKKGKSGKISIDYSGSVSFDNILRKLDVFNGPEWAQLKRDAFIGSRTYNTSISNTNPTKLYFPDPMADYQLFKADPNVWESVAMGYDWINLNPATNTFVARKRATTAEERTLLTNLGLAVLDSVAMYDPSKVRSYDWQSKALRTGMTQSHNISLAAGSDKFRSSFSSGYFDQKGIQFGQDFKRYTVSLSTDFKPIKIINVGSNINYANSIQNAGSTPNPGATQNQYLGPDVYNGANGMLPLALPYDANGNLIFYPGNDANIVNPLNDPNSLFDEVRSNRLLANVFADVQVYKGLRFRSAFGVDVRNLREGVFNGSRSSVRQGNPASGEYRTLNRLDWTLQNMLNYDLRIGEKHAFAATLVQELVKKRAEGDTMTAENLIYESQKWYSLQNNTLGVTTSRGSFWQSQLLSFLGRVNYTYNNKYLITFSLRNDNSSVLSEGRKGELFPSAALAWRIDQEEFMQQVPLVTALKLRLGYGSVGNSSIDPYLTKGTLVRSYYNWGDQPAGGYGPGTLPLPDLTWEKTNTKNIALDFGIWRNRIAGTIDLYESNTNQIQNKSIPAAQGYTGILVNLGKVRNRGVEIGLTTTNIDNGKLKWVTEFVFARNREQITTLDGTKNDNIGNQWFIGQPTQIYYDYKWQGVFQYADTMPGGILADYFWKKSGNRSNANLQPGRIKVADLTGDTLLTEADKTVLGSHNPKWTGSINSTLSYKGFDLSIYVYIRHGSMLRDMRPSENGRYQSFKIDYWTPTNPTNEFAQANNTIDIQQYWQSIGFRDASFVRVRSISLTYHIPGPLLSKMKLSNLSFYCNAVNPFLFSKYDRVDPETVPYLSSYPSSSTTGPGPNSYSFRSFTLGLRAGL